MAAKPKNMYARKGAVLLNKREVQAQQWFMYFMQKFDELTSDLYDATILILAGRHGEEDGSIGRQDEKVFGNHEKMVIINDLKSIVSRFLKSQIAGANNRRKF